VTSLSFHGQCSEAFEFYAKVLGGRITAAMPYEDGFPDMPITDEKHRTWLRLVGRQIRRAMDDQHHTFGWMDGVAGLTPCPGYACHCYGLMRAGASPPVKFELTSRMGIPRGCTTFASAIDDE